MKCGPPYKEHVIKVLGPGEGPEGAVKRTLEADNVHSH
jgi:hypothetical protein